jgi:hypothetical protein
MNVNPFPHVVLDWWFPKELLEQVAVEFPHGTTPGWRVFGNDKEVKYEGGPSMWGWAACEYFDKLECRTDELGEMFGIDGLSMEYIGGGYHLIPPGGRLAMHADFNHSPDTGFCRRLNVLTYLNTDWSDPGGTLILGENSEVSVAPEMGRTVIFATSATSWHGHPEPTVKRWRKSIAAYFFTEAHAPDCDQSQRSTVWL